MGAKESLNRAELLAQLQAARQRIAELEALAADSFAPKNRQDSQLLRKRAEETLAALHSTLPAFESKDIKEAVHELSVHQIELEMQNEELRHSEERLQSANEYREALFHRSPMGYVVLDADGNIHEANEAADALFKYPYNLTATTLRFFVVREHHPLLQQARTKAASEASARCEVKYTRFKDTAVRWLRIYISSLQAQGEALPYYLCALEDITADKNMELNLVMAKKAMEEEVRKRTLELSRANQELLESREKFRAYFDWAGEGIFISDSQSNILRANPLAVQMLGYESEAQLQGLNARELIHPEDLEKLPLSKTTEKVAGFDVVRVERRYRKADGSYLPVAVTIKLIPGIDQHHVIFKDITEKLQAQELLQRSEAEKTLILESISDMVAFYDSDDLRIRWANRAAASSVGLECSELVGRYCHDVWNGGHAPCSGCPVLETFRSGRAQEFERASPDGRIWKLRSYPAHDAQGRLKGVVEVGREITEQLRAEAALHQSERRFQQLMENVDMVAVQGYDTRRRVVFWNKASERLYGYSREEALGKAIEELIIPETMQDDVLRNIQDWLEHDKPIPAGELELQRKDGAIVPVYSCHVMQESPHGDKELFCIDVDLSAIRLAREQLLQAKNEAEAANRAKSEFLANMSHELRTPLNGVMGMLELLKGTYLDPRQHEYADLASQACRRLARLMGDILDFTRIEVGKMEIRAETFDLKETVQAVIETFTPAASRGAVELTLLYDRAIAPRLCGDAARLQQVLNNLVGNALKFTKAGSVLVDVTALSCCRENEQRVLFAVADTGVGIRDSKLGELFEPFTQAEGSFTRQFQGAGLGLSIVKRLVLLMGGVISVESREGQGTTFYVSIPFGLVQEAEEQEPPILQGGQEQGFPVLLAEDDPLNAMVMVRLLGNAGFTVHAVTDGRQVLDALKREEYKLVLMDVQMPVMDGLETAQRIRSGEAGAASSGIPIIALTAYAMSGDREKCLAAGMNDYLPKPVELAALRRVIEANL